MTCLVGPRPLHLNTKISIHQIKKRFNVKPGLTGLAQIQIHMKYHGLNNFKIDIWYVENHNLLLDLKDHNKNIIIIIKSIGKKEIKDKNKFDGTN